MCTYRTTPNQSYVDTVTSLNFKNYVLLEQIRSLEETVEFPDQPFTTPDSSATAHHADFLTRLVTRAKSITRQQQLQAQLDQPARLHRGVSTAAKLLCALLGVLAVAKALAAGSSDQHAINIYWLMLVLLGFNLLSMLLWLIGGVTQMSGLLSGTLGQLPITALQLFKSTHAPAARAWFSCHYTGAPGLWRISAMSHLLWLIYLLTGLCTLILLFAAQQYDFYWGSTLLSLERFTSLTDLLSRPLHVLGLTTPTIALLDASQAGIHSASAEIRQQWALFLISVLIMYGIFPRFICWLIARLMLLRSERQSAPNFYLPYYIHLHQVMMPSASAANIVDPQKNTPLLGETGTGTKVGAGAGAGLGKKTNNVNAKPTTAQWPENCVVIGIELTPPTAPGITINILNKADLRQAQDQLQREAQQAVALVANVHNIPDRGVQRQLNALFALRKPAQRWLFIQGEQATDPTQTNTRQRLSDWYRAAQQAGVPATQIQRIHSPLADSAHFSGEL